MDTETNTNILPSEENLTIGDYTLPDCITYILTGLHIIVVGVSVIGNVTVVSLFLLKKRSKTNANCYLTAMAVSDILLIMCCEPFTVFSDLFNYHWIFGHFMCSTVSFVQTSCVIQRSFTLVASSLDRYRAIRWPLKEQTSRAVVICIIIALWIVSLVLSAPVAIFSQIVFQEYDNVSSTCLEVWPNDEYRRAFSIILLVLTYFLPLLVLTITYLKIAFVLQEKPPGEEYYQLLKRRRNMKRRTVQVFLLAFCTYAFCWLPIHVITIIGDITPAIYNEKSVHVIWLFAQCLAVSNAAVNPIIVLARQNNFRSQLYSRCSFFVNQRRGNELVRENSFKHKLRQMKRTSTQISFSHPYSSATGSQRKRRHSSCYSWRGESEPTPMIPPRIRRSSTLDSYIRV